jgi:hypothetical protein
MLYGSAQIGEKSRSHDGVMEAKQFYDNYGSNKLQECIKSCSLLVPSLSLRSNIGLDCRMSKMMFSNLRDIPSLYRSLRPASFVPSAKRLLDWPCTYVG